MCKIAASRSVCILVSFYFMTSSFPFIVVRTLVERDPLRQRAAWSLWVFHCFSLRALLVDRFEPVFSFLNELVIRGAQFSEPLPLRR